MTITLAEALTIRATILKRIEEFKTERNINISVQALEIEDTDVVMPSRTPEIIQKDLYDANRDYLELFEKINLANINNTISAEEFGFKAINLITAIELAKIMRKELMAIKEMSNNQKVVYESAYGGFQRGEKKIKTVLTYNPDEYRIRAIDLERKVNRLSASIEKANYDIKFEYAPAEKYI